MDNCLSTLIFPVIAVAVGILVGGEHMEWRELVGSSIVVAGIGVSLAPSRALKETYSDTG